MRKEEIKEVKHACDRDRKYLKTNFTSETYCVEESIITSLPLLIFPIFITGISVPSDKSLDLKA